MAGEPPATTEPTSHCVLLLNLHRIQKRHVAAQFRSHIFQNLTGNAGTDETFP
jgi:hypothetical protein